MCLRPEFDMFLARKKSSLFLGSLNYRKTERKKTTKKWFDQIPTFMCLRPEFGHILTSFFRANTGYVIRF